MVFLTTMSVASTENHQDPQSRQKILGTRFESGTSRIQIRSETFGDALLGAYIVDPNVKLRICKNICFTTGKKKTHLCCQTKLFYDNFCLTSSRMFYRRLSRNYHITIYIWQQKSYSVSPEKLHFLQSRNFTCGSTIYRGMTEWLHFELLRMWKEAAMFYFMALFVY